MPHSSLQDVAAALTHELEGLGADVTSLNPTFIEFHFPPYVLSSVRDGSITLRDEKHVITVEADATVRALPTAVTIAIFVALGGSAGLGVLGSAAMSLLLGACVLVGSVSAARSQTVQILDSAVRAVTGQRPRLLDLDGG